MVALVRKSAPIWCVNAGLCFRVRFVMCRRVGTKKKQPSSFHSVEASHVLKLLSFFPLTVLCPDTVQAVTNEIVEVAVPVSLILILISALIVYYFRIYLPRHPPRVQK